MLLRARCQVLVTRVQLKRCFYSKRNLEKVFKKNLHVSNLKQPFAFITEYLIMFAGTGFGGSAPVTTDIELQGGDLEQSITALSKKQNSRKFSFIKY